MTSGPNTPITSGAQILDPTGYLQNVSVPGKSGTTIPKPFATQSGVPTTDGVRGVGQGDRGRLPENATTQWGYAYQKTSDDGIVDISNMSPPSLPITLIQGSQTLVQGDSSPDSTVGVVIIYRTAQGGGLFYYDGQVPNTPGTRWSFVDTNTDDDLNENIQAQVNGEGTPLPTGATCMAYHLERIFVAVGNVVYVSSGPDAVVSGSSGNAGFDQTFTLQSKITRFWVTSIGLIVFTVRDSYVFFGSAQPGDPLGVMVYIPQLPLLVYDCFTEFMGTGYLYLGTRMVVALNPGSGINEVSFPVANYLADTTNGYDPASSFLTFHSQGSSDTALYIANGVSEWLRMTLSTVPESGSAWNPPAIFSAGTSAVQSVEILPGIFRLLIGPHTDTINTNGPILQRDRASTTDNHYELAAPFSYSATIGSIALTDPGQLAGLAWMTLTTTTAGSAPNLSALIGEIEGTFEEIPRTRQDPPDLPLPDSIRSDRHYFMQNQNFVWCRHFQFKLDWPAEAAFNELLTFTIVGQVMQEMKGS